MTSQYLWDLNLESPIIFGALAAALAASMETGQEAAVPAVLTVPDRLLWPPETRYE
jgi:hypothetical protein